jgi:hypothetical protein
MTALLQHLLSSHVLTLLSLVVVVVANNCMIRNIEEGAPPLINNIQCHEHYWLHTSSLGHSSRLLWFPLSLVIMMIIISIPPPSVFSLLILIVIRTLRPDCEVFLTPVLLASSPPVFILLVHTNNTLDWNSLQAVDDRRRYVGAHGRGRPSASTLFPPVASSSAICFHEGINYINFSPNCIRSQWPMSARVLRVQI